MRCPLVCEFYEALGATTGQLPGAPMAAKVVRRAGVDGGEHGAARGIGPTAGRRRGRAPACASGPPTSVTVVVVVIVPFEARRRLPELRGKADVLHAAEHEAAAIGIGGDIDHDRRGRGADVHLEAGVAHVDVARSWRKR